MKRRELPSIQGRRFDIETLQDNAFSLAEQATRGPTWLRHEGRISFVVLSEELFNKVWPDSRRSWSIDEMPYRDEKMLLSALENVLTDESSGNNPKRKSEDDP